MDGNKTISLEVLVSKMEEASKGWNTYLNVQTGEFVHLSDGSYVEADPILAEKIENSRDYIRLPEQREFHDRQTMMDFVNTLDDDYTIMRLSRALNSSRPYRRFKDVLASFGLIPAYYSFRRHCLAEIAKEWCEKNKIDCI